jgi:restriction endonuclease S subunit
MKPKISFKGFKEPWEVSTLSNFFSKVNEKNARMLYSAVLTNSAEYGIIDQRDYFDFDVANSNNISGYYIVQPDDFVYNPRVSVTAPVGPINKNELGYTGVMSPLYLVFKINRINKDYLCHYFKSNKWHKFMRISGNCGARFDRLSISDEQFVQMPIPYPINSKEQQTICNYLEKIDKLISTASSRLASLKQVKEASLQAMFPQKGETVPKIRFKGFEEEWEEVKLKDISTKVIEKNRLNNISITLTNSAEYGIINQRDFFDHDVSNTDNVSGYFIVQPNDFVYNPRISTLAPVGPINMNKLGYAGVVSPLYYVFRVTGINKSFLDIYFHTNVWHKFMKDNGNTGARFDRLSINNEMFYEMPIYCPRDENEQQHIASYFTSLDKQIALQTQRLEKLKQIKAACLDKMFV